MSKAGEIILNLKKHLKSEIVDEATGDILCGCGCGYVLEQKSTTLKNSLLESDPVKRESQKQHKSISNKYHDGGLGTSIHGYDKLHEAPENTQMRSMIHRFSKLQKITRLSKSEDYRISRLFQTLSAIIEKNNMPEIIMDRCIEYVHRAEKLQILKGKKRSVVAITLIYLASKELSCVYKPENDIKEVGLKHSYFSKTVLYLKSELKINYDSLQTKLILLEKYRDELGLKHRIVEQTRTILQYCNSKPLFISKQDRIWVGVAVWLSCKNDKDYKFNNFPQLNDATTLNVSENSIRKLQELLNNKGIIQTLKLKTTLKKNIGNYSGMLNV